MRRFATSAGQSLECEIREWILAILVLVPVFPLQLTRYQIPLDTELIMATVNTKGDTVLKEGWAVKESGQAFLGKTNWKRRWCRLVKTRDGVTTWSYYRKMDDIGSNQPAGSVELDSTYVARELETREEKNKPFCFALGPVFDDMARRTYYVSCDSEENKLSWMEVLSASIETDNFSSERFNDNRRSVRSRMDRRTKKKRSQKTLSAPAQMSSSVLQVKEEYMNPNWRMEQWRCLCSVIKEAIWKKTDTKNGVTLSRLSFKHECCAVIKVEGCLPVPPDVTYDYLLTAMRPGGKFDQFFRNEEVLEVIDDSIPRASIVTNTYSLPMPSMSKRECCLLRCWIPSYITKNNTCGLFVTSVNYPLHKPAKGSVRVQVQPSGFVLSPVQNKDGSLHTLVSALGQIDVQDSLQSMLEATFKSGLLKIGLRTGFAHISNQIEKYYTLINR